MNIDELRNSPNLVMYEECKMLYLEIEQVPNWTPWPSYSAQEKWRYYYGELFLTKDRLVFIKAGGCIAAQKKITFSSPLTGIGADVIRPLLGFPFLEITAGSTPVRFAVEDPSEWLAAIEEIL